MLVYITEKNQHTMCSCFKPKNIKVLKKNIYTHTYIASKLEPTNSDNDVMFYLQLLSKIVTTLENLCTRKVQSSCGGCSRRVHKIVYLAV